MTITASAPVPAGSRLVDAVTADLTAIRRQGTNVGRFPTNQPYTGRAAVVPELTAADRDLIERARLTDPQRFRQLGEAIALGGEAGKNAVEQLARQWGVFPQGGAR